MDDLTMQILTAQRDTLRILRAQETKDDPEHPAFGLYSNAAVGLSYLLRFHSGGNLSHADCLHGITEREDCRATYRALTGEDA